jgi:NADPH:quinone reductase-like Zn-dependent oxidoreductase
MRAVQLTAYGNPVEGLNYVDIPAPQAPGPNQVLIGIEFSPLNPSDLLLARGIYALRPPLPTVIGNEGVGRVLAVGSGVVNVKVGDRVLAPLSSFTWRERMVVSADGLSPCLATSIRSSWRCWRSILRPRLSYSVSMSI